jgi:hypothetical protein
MSAGYEQSPASARSNIACLVLIPDDVHRIFKDEHRFDARVTTNQLERMGQPRLPAETELRETRSALHKAVAVEHSQTARHWPRASRPWRRTFMRYSRRCAMATQRSQAASSKHQARPVITAEVDKADSSRPPARPAMRHPALT